ncbi:ERF family protein [Gemmatimonas sp.]|uniref:ERF family protein n=1 Tax=Gemmatimonas sp. TaxID=1962908 RepID=UPI0027BA0E6C|nr:ERF family protein [Gemmatimonas sp.]
MGAVKDVALVDQPNSLAVFERLATDPKMNVETLERLVQMHERAAARVSEEQFNAAMSEAQREMRPVAEDASNPQTHSKYASYAAIDKALRPIYTKHGFGVSFDTGDVLVADYVRILCYVSHSGGHKRTYKVDMPADGKGARGNDVMTKTHATGAAMSYGMRYLLKMIFNVAVGEDDRDGNTVSPTPEPPANYDDLMAAFDDSASQGYPASRKFFSGLPESVRNYALKYAPARLAEIKAKAQKVAK